MKIGSIYAYYDPVSGRAMYVGSVQDCHSLLYRHRKHLKQNLPVDRWLRSLPKAPVPIELKRVEFASALYLHLWEDSFMAQLKTRKEDGGLNHFSACSPPDHSEIAKAGGLIGGRRTHELHPNQAAEMGRTGGRKNVESGQLASIRNFETCSKGGKVGGGRHEMSLEAKERIRAGGSKGGSKAKGRHGVGAHFRWHIKAGKPCTCGSQDLHVTQRFV